MRSQIMLGVVAAALMAGCASNASYERPEVSKGATSTPGYAGAGSSASSPGADGSSPSGSSGDSGSSGSNK